MKTRSNTNQSPQPATPAKRLLTGSKSVMPPGAGRPRGASLHNQRRGQVKGERMATRIVLSQGQVLVPACLPTGSEFRGFSLEVAATYLGIHPDLLDYYCRRGLLGESMRGESPRFSPEVLEQVRLIGYYRSRLKAGRLALRLLCEFHRLCVKNHVTIAVLNPPYSGFTPS